MHLDLGTQVNLLGFKIGVDKLSHNNSYQALDFLLIMLSRFIGEYKDISDLFN